jgi:hypothetical protein
LARRGFSCRCCAWRRPPGAPMAAACTPRPDF